MSVTHVGYTYKIDISGTVGGLPATTTVNVEIEPREVGSRSQQVTTPHLTVSAVNQIASNYAAQYDSGRVVAITSTSTSDEVEEFTEQIS